jgi:xyloglucan-specific endo-beta-1,4-glucanase
VERDAVAIRTFPPARGSSRGCIKHIISRWPSRHRPPHAHIHVMFAKLAVLASLATLALGAPAAVPQPAVDTSSHCGQYDSVQAAPYTLFLDQWGISGASGSDCAQITSLSGSTIAWKSTWSWAGGNGVKTFSNVQLNSGLNKQLSAIKSIQVSPGMAFVRQVTDLAAQSTWNWSNSGSGIVADVAYDLFTSASPSGGNAYEIMIWLANFNAGPISYNYGSNGQPTPVASNLSIAGHSWSAPPAPAARRAR